MLLLQIIALVGSAVVRPPIAQEIAHTIPGCVIIVSHHYVPTGLDRIVGVRHGVQYHIVEVQCIGTALLHDAVDRSLRTVRDGKLRHKRRAVRHVVGQPDGNGMRSCIDCSLGIFVALNLICHEVGLLRLQPVVVRTARHTRQHHHQPHVRA